MRSGKPTAAPDDSPPTARHRLAFLPLAAVIALLASGVFVVQFVSDAPSLGIGGLLALVAPGILAALATSPRLRRRPTTLLLVLAVTLSFAVMLGIAAAMTPRGLDSRTIAGIGQLVLTLAFGAWLVRSRQLARHADSRTVLRAPAAIPTAPRIPRLRSIVLVVAGVAMAGVGVFVARGAAENQAFAPYVVLWSGPSTATAEPVVGVANASGTSLDCSLELTRPGAAPVRWAIDAIADGATWQDPLPAAASDQRAAWLLLLKCAAPGGTTLERELRIEPPA